MVRARKRLFAGLVAIAAIAALLGWFTVGRIGGIVAENQDFAPSKQMMDAFNRALPKEYTPYGQPPKPGENRPPWGTYVPPEHAAGAMASRAKGRAGGGPPAAAAPDEERAVSGPTTARLVASQSPQPDRLLIRNATITVEVKNARDAARRLTALANAQRGYVGNLTESVDDLGARTVSVQVRLPYSRFERMTQDLESLGKLQDMRVGAEDVTEEFTDAQARMRNLKRTELRLLDHLDSSRRLRDTLELESQVSRVREEVEQIEGRLRFMAHRIAFCTFDVTLTEAPRQQALVPPATFSTAKIASDASRSMVAFLQGVWSIVIWLGVWAIVWVPAGAAAFAMSRRMWRFVSGVG